MAKYVPSKTFIFDETVKKNEAPYVLTYNPLPSHPEDIDGLNFVGTGKKIPFIITLAGMLFICGAAWAGMVFAIIKLANH